MLIAVLAGCATSGQRRRALFVGDWVYADKTQRCRYSFAADGIFRGEVFYKGATISRFTGRWVVNNDALLYTYLTDAFGRIPAGTRDRDEVLEVNRDWFLIRAANGEQRRYRRVR
jgi:hypothetical protein